MTSQGILKLINSLMTYYPKTYSPVMDQDRAKVMAADFQRAFEKYEDKTVLDAAYNWHLRNTEACTVADLIAAIYNAKPMTQEEFDKPTVWKDYFEDEEGYGYATNCKTGEVDCIWKPRWRNDRSFNYNGREIHLPAKQKSKVLKEHGITW